MARGYGIANYGEAYYGITKYVDGAATASPSCSVTANATATFNSAQPQTITAAVTANANMVRVKSVETIVQTSSAVVTSAEIVVVGDASISASLLMTTDYIRIREVNAIMTVQCAMTSVAREKWEPIADSPETWTAIADTDQIWTEVA